MQLKLLVTIFIFAVFLEEGKTVETMLKLILIFKGILRIFTQINNQVSFNKFEQVIFELRKWISIIMSYHESISKNNQKRNKLIDY